MAQEIRSVDGIDVFIEGEGAHTVLMVHGWPDTYRLWDGQVAHLKDRYRCARFTLPGFDIAKPSRPMSMDQMMALFKAILEAVAPGQKVTLMLHDWGCLLGYEFYARHPELVQRVVGVDIGDFNSGELARSRNFKAKFGVFYYQMWLAIAWMIGGSLGTRMTRSMARALRCRSDPAYIGAQMNYLYHMVWFGSHGGMRGMARVEPFKPMLFIYGERKPFMFHSKRWLEKLAALPGCEAKAFATGHWVMMQQPEAFNRCVTDWLVGTETVSALPSPPPSPMAAGA